MIPVLLNLSVPRPAIILTFISDSFIPRTLPSAAKVARTPCSCFCSHLYSTRFFEGRVWTVGSPSPFDVLGLKTFACWENTSAWW